MKKISLVIPMYNEEAMVSLLLKTIDEKVTSPLKGKYDVEIVTINDGSRDNTLELLKKEQENYHNLVIVNLSRNWGQEPAIRAGLMTATGDCVIPMDADLQDPPEAIPQMLEMWEKGFDVVNAKRVSRKKDSAFKRNTAGLFYRYIEKLSPKVKIPNNVNNFRLMDRRVVDEINNLGGSNRVLRVEVPFVGFKTGIVEIARAERAKGESHYPLSAMMNLAKNSILALTTKPLEIAIKVFVCFCLTFALSATTELVLFILHLTHVLTLSEIALWAWLVINVVLLVTSIVSMVMAIQSIYIGKAVNESTGHPSVIIKEVFKK